MTDNRIESIRSMVKALRDAPNNEPGIGTSTLEDEAAEMIEALSTEVNRLSSSDLAQDLIVANTEVAQLKEQINEAVKILRTIEWVGSGAKGLIEDAINFLLPEPPKEPEGVE